MDFDLTALNVFTVTVSTEGDDGCITLKSVEDALKAVTSFRAEFGNNVDITTPQEVTASLKMIDIGETNGEMDVDELKGIIL